MNPSTRLAATGVAVTVAAAPLPAANEAAAPRTFTPAYRTYVLVTLCVVGFLCYVDRIVITMFMQPIKKDFGLTDTQLGLMTGLAFALLGGIAAIPLARMADQRSRKWIIGGSLFVWTLMTAATGMATNYVQLLLARVGVGVGEAGCVPASHSMLADYYPRELRSRALGAHTAGQFLGMLGGMVMGGILVQTVGWRAGFVWLGIGGLVLYAIFHLTVREPARVDEQRNPALPAASVMRRLGDLKCFAWLVVAFATTNFAGSIAAWLPTYLERAFALQPMQIGLGLGLSLGLATSIGALTGGQLGVRYSKHSKSWASRFTAVVSFAVMPMYVGTLYAPTPAIAFTLLFATFILAGMIAGPVFATLQDLVDPSVRATGTAIVALAGVVVGQGMGPLVVGFLSDLWQAGPNSVSGLRMAMTAVALVNFLTVWVFWSLGRRIDLLGSRAR